MPIKVCFIYDSWDNKKTLEVYSKMTPQRSGKWKDMIGVEKQEEADFCVIIDKTSRVVPREKAIYISAHPTNYPGHHNPDEYLVKIDYEDTSGFLEWWLEYDYDYLSSLKCGVKNRNACCIVSNANSHDYQKDRLRYLDEFLGKYPNDIDIYGRVTPFGNLKDSYKGSLGQGGDKYWFGKEILSDYRYSLEFDAYCKNYFSERFADSLLMWCLPIYSGGYKEDMSKHEVLPSLKFRDVWDYPSTPERIKHF